MGILDLFIPPFTLKKYFINILISAVLFFSLPFIFSFILAILFSFILSTSFSTRTVDELSSISVGLAYVVSFGYFLIFMGIATYHGFKFRLQQMRELKKR